MAPRAWFFGAQMGEQTFLTLCTAATAASTPAPSWASRRGGPGHPAASRRSRRPLALPADVYAVILPKEIADALGITAETSTKQRPASATGGIDYASSA